MSIEVRHMRQFVAVAEELHFSRAAERLRIAQPALSAQIRRLEEKLEFRLFERNTRTVRLTPEGEALFAVAKRALEEWDDVILVAGSLRRGESGTVSLGVSLRMHSGIRLDVQRHLATTSPGVTVEFAARSSARLVDDMAAGVLDAAICLAPARHPGLRYQRLRDDPVVAALPSGHPLANEPDIDLRDLQHEVWLMPDRTLGSAAMLEEMWTEDGFTPRTGDDLTTNFDDEFLAVALGEGIAVVTKSLVPRRRVDGVAFVPVAKRSIPMQLVLRAEPPSPALGYVIRAVTESLGSVQLAPSGDAD